MAKPDCEHEKDTHCIHSSERRNFRNCRQRWYFTFPMNFVPAETAKPLEFGIAFHEGMEAIYNPEAWDDTSDDEKLEAGIKAFTDTCTKQRARFLRLTGQHKLDEAYKDDYEERISLGVGMLTHYMREVHPLADKWFRPVAVEIPFAVNLKWPDIARTKRLGYVPGDDMVCTNSPQCGQAHPNPAPVTLNGRVDALVEDLAYGGYYVVDWKTAAQMIVNGDYLQLDDQITSYCAALQLIFNLDIRGFLYSEIKKAYPEPPARLQRLTQGRRLSTKKDQPTTYAIAKKAMEEIDPEALEAGFYDEYLELLQDERKAPKFHQRFPVRQSDTKLWNVLENVAKEAMEMVDAELPIYTSASKQNCGGCAYAGPCLGKMNGEDYIYTLTSSFGTRSKPKDV